MSAGGEARADDRLFERAKAAADMRAYAEALSLRRAGRRWRGVCPFGRCGETSKSAPFWLSEGKRFGCFSCGEEGDVIALEHELNGRGGETLRHAAARILKIDLGVEAKRDHPGAGGDGYAPVQGVSGAGLKPRRARAEFAGREALEARREAYIREVARALWGEARAAAGTPVELYLRARRLSGWVLASMLQQLRFHPAAQHSVHRDRTFPAMIGLIVAPSSASGGEGVRPVPTGGVHATYLAEGGDLVWRKAEIERAKTIWGPPKLDDRIWGGVWLTPPTAAGPLTVGEGIESTGSAMQLAGSPHRGVATLSLNALQGRWLEDRWGRVDTALPRLDPEAPGFTWPEPEGAPFGEVRVCVDRDMSPIRRRVRKAGGGTFKPEIDGEARARICASLAAQGWRRTLDANGGRGTSVRTWAPGPGRDFSNELAARIAAGSHETVRGAPGGVFQ